MQPLLPLIVEPAQLAEQLGAQKLLIVDLCKPEIYASQHIPGAVHLDYTRLIMAQPPVMGLLPDDDHLSELCSALGLGPDMHVVAYDDEGGVKACRLLWTLDVIGHAHFSLLNGGLRAWLAGRHPVSKVPARASASHYQVARSGRALADKEVIVYCQTHHRSSHTYIALKSLGYPRIKGYPGAWSEWGNSTDTPVEAS